MNLALFRIVTFGMIWRDSYSRMTPFFSGLPQELLYPPPGLEKILEIIPINPELTMVIGSIMCISAFFAMIGFCTTLSASIAVLSAVYYLGIPNFFGKIDHGHFIIWFGAILASSRCSDFLSVDALLKGFQNSKKGTFISVKPSNEYGLPIRFVFILFGILYFFPGFWKWWHGGIDWIITDNLRNRMYFKWYELNGWLPIFRIDQHPTLCKLGAGGTVLFELSFILLIFFNRLRYLAVFGGLFFHNMTFIFMKIGFFCLQKCYIVFFDWYKIFGWIGKKTFKSQLTVIINEESKSVRVLVAFLKVFDIFSQTEYKGKDAYQILNGTEGNKEDYYGIIDSNVIQGKKVLILLALRNPILWGLFPFLYLFAKKSKVSNILTDQIKNTPSLISYKDTLGSSRKILVRIVAIILIIGNTYCGFGRYGGIDSWPFAVYPTFAQVMNYPGKLSTKFVLLDANDKEIHVDWNILSDKFGDARYWGLLYSILLEEDPQERSRRLLPLLNVLVRYEPNIQRVRKIKLYRVVYDTIPENKGQPPVYEQLLIVQEIQ